MKTQEINVDNKASSTAEPISTAQHPIFTATETLYSGAKVKSIMLGILAGFFLPVVFLELLGFPHSLEYLTRFIFGALILIPIIAYFLFMYMQNYFKCPQCEALWSYQKIGETMVETTFRTSVNRNNEAINLLKERYLEEFECSKCHYKNFTPKTRRITEMSK